jgi:hypothetical protein
MKRFDYRLVIGAALVLGGILMLLDQANIIRGATSFFWAGIFAVLAAVFLYWFVSDHSRWWAAIPGCALAGMAASSLLLDRLGLGGLAFLGSIGVGFWLVYITNRQRWWAIIPGGVLVTLGVESGLTEAYNIVNTSGVLFVGLGITFLLVALLANHKWAFIPAAVLLLMGFFLGAPFSGIWQYAWISILLASGAVLIIASFLPRK